MDETEKDKLVEEGFRFNSHKTTQQTMASLEVNQYFQEDVANLRKKYAHIIKEFEEKFTETEALADTSILDPINLPEKITSVEELKPLLDKLKNQFKNVSKEDAKELVVSQVKALLTLANRPFTDDLIEVCKKYNLSPIENWLHQIRTYVVMKHLLPPDFLMTAGLGEYLTPEEIIHTPQGLNFVPYINTNPVTGEKKLSMDFMDNTTYKTDLKKGWNIIEKVKKLMRKEKGVKQFYPIKSLPVVEKLQKITENTVSDEVEDQDLKMNDIDRALEIFDDIPFNAEAEIKAGNRLRQLKHQHKKRSKGVS